MTKKVVVSQNLRKVSERIDQNGNVIRKIVQEPGGKKKEK